MSQRMASKTSGWSRAAERLLARRLPASPSLARNRRRVLWRRSDCIRLRL